MIRGVKLNRNLVGICSLICILTSPSCNNPVSDSSGGTVKEIVRDVENAKSNWQRAGLNGYSYVFNWSCFCLPSYTQQVTIDVDSDTITAIWQTNDSVPLPDSLYTNYHTVPELFELINSQLERNPYRADLEFDSELGYPLSAFIDFEEAMADEEWGFGTHSLLQSP